MSGGELVVGALALVVVAWLVAELHGARHLPDETRCEAWLRVLLDHAPAEGVGVRRARMLAAVAGFSEHEFEQALARLIERGVVTRLRGRTEPTIGASDAP